MKLFDPDSPIMSFLARVADLVILNVLWLLCCLPVVTAGASTPEEHIQAVVETLERL